MDHRRHRYPGAQPFSDDESSRGVFFGRGDASRKLTDKILANRLVVVYGRSGLGKTSLLNAGVAPLLREEGYLPLFLRVNDTAQGPLHAVLQGISTEARRQQVEFTEGLTDSLWGFFKTAEFWRGDLLLTPVLVLDQFEELFTLQDEAARARFLDELSYLIRGIRPPSASSETHAELSERPPAVRILLSLREDYLGYLEEAADHVPQIFDARFRLSPLDIDAAAEAITGPAQVQDAQFETRPFAFAAETVEGVLDFLSRRRSERIADARRYVEPFQLQLICSRIEQIVATRQRQTRADVTISMADIGGETALTQTLKDFYGDAVRAIPGKRERKATRRLCEEYLISAEGRRLSLEGYEIRRQLGLGKETLKQLVSSRLIRAENRADSIYYELSHDALVEPILVSQRKKAIMRGWFGIVAGTTFFVFFGAVLMIALAGLTVYEFESEGLARVGEGVGLTLMLLALFVFLVISVVLLRSSARTLVRYRRAREASQIDSDQALSRQWGSVVSGIFGLSIGALCILFGLLILFIQGIFVWGWVDPEAAVSMGDAFEIGEFVEAVNENGFGVDFFANLFGTVALLVIGGRLGRWGILRMVNYPLKRSTNAAAVAATDAGSMNTVLKNVLGGLFVVAAALLAVSGLMLLGCTWLWPVLGWEWVQLPGFSVLSLQCAAGYDSVFADLMGDAFLIACCLYVAWLCLRRGDASRDRRAYAGVSPVR